MSRAALFHRSEMLVGPAAMAALRDAKVILFGIGGVGSWTAEALIRTGIGHLVLVDSDRVCITNVNRQVQATTGNVGCSKVQELAFRLRIINPEATIVAREEVYGFDTKDAFDLASHDYVLDAIDSLSPKLGLIEQALGLPVTLFSAMGASGKMDPTRVRTGSVWKSCGCPLARRIRKRMRHHGIAADFQVVYSDEQRVSRGIDAVPVHEDRPVPGCNPASEDAAPASPSFGPSHKAFLNGSLVQVTATFGMCLASLVINDVVARSSGLPPELGIR